MVLQGFNSNLTLLDSRNANKSSEDQTISTDQTSSIDNTDISEKSDSSEDDDDIPF